MFITNEINIAKLAYAGGAECIFVDLEILGKKERQGHLNTVISCHTIEDVRHIRKAVPRAELLVRINPVNPRTAQEIDSVVKAGADVLMLPMFHTYEEVLAVTHIIDNRLPLILLVETPAAVDNLPDIIKLPGIKEIYIGLNDLSLALKFKFMFQPLADGMLEKMADVLHSENMPFGFGGIARIGQGKLPSELILSEHLRLGSSRVILSRAFYADLGIEKIDFAYEIERLREAEYSLAQRDKKQINQDHKKLITIINNI